MERVLPQLQNMQEYFASGATRQYQFRKLQLQKLKEALYKHEKEIYAALYDDLKKNPEECWVTEIGSIIAEINFALKNLRGWMHPKKVGTNLLNFPGKSYIVPEPLGVVLIIGPWNYPLQLLLSPLIGAIAGGNCVVLKPSEIASATANLLQKIIHEIFDDSYIKLVQGNGATIIPQMMNAFRFDHVFYTGSTQVGSVIYAMAAKELIPVTLELGGKSPCIVESDANIKVAAKRIAMTKFSNAGQMCVAPDYVLVHETIKEDFLKELKGAVEKFYNAEPAREYYAKIINRKQFERLVSYMESATIYYGGKYDMDSSFIQPAILTNVMLNSPVMKEEIFGPVLPVLSWKDDAEVYKVVQQHSNPLALYVFTSSNKKAKKWTRSIAFGGGCINNASWHLTNPHLPFGGRGNSGIGNYHGKFSFETFTHKKAIMKTPTWFDPAIKYPPLKGKLNLFKKIIR
jgi:aldehyde dehydrogenase (NAD+)